MWESEGLGGEDVLWASTAFNGGIAGQQQAPCGALSSAVVCLGLRHRCDREDREQARQARETARREANQLFEEFRREFGAFSCIDLIGVRFSDADGYRRFREEGIGEKKCLNYVKYLIQRLYEMAGA
ncbi:MAG: C_GCAxxG_C_C family protein [Dehalococcoidales bacterium]|nr:MAG: C_GCAxxG_C_C family protein [Dehalococcoidales bacterium]